MVSFIKSEKIKKISFNPSNESSWTVVLKEKKDEFKIIRINLIFFFKKKNNFINIKNKK
jgi:hypothetical protein